MWYVPLRLNPGAMRNCSELPRTFIAHFLEFQQAFARDLKGEDFPTMAGPRRWWLSGDRRVPVARL